MYLDNVREVYVYMTRTCLCYNYC